ncbi:hypothetical protein JAB5_17560 [Janthinobacterium sp. HH103]|uniref:hypothetical protein n=1 Tax=unclassified Janthinobacterium TaxID=2610881 RepID=UPI0008754F36|nr:MULTISPECIES: hypothetical protein [unclassified Janthinobacterium]MCC7681747.1 hypothetical protein [Janthinobacterium sp. FW305-128]OEZ70955.1 hypothetical protein JAB2_07960 [Janthinobacterium sp. HH100]OEZ82362.1 hypothetical protein JAB5_17560 [Janthinobacterium sp. HH103]QOU74446.1 hypothetical protein JAB4_039110 [Janthinobacterium sp. HH102]
MSVLQELDELLCGDDEEYDRLDLFQEADELIGQLRTADVPALLALWPQREPCWQERFTQASASIDGAVLRALLAGLLQIQERSHGVFELMSRLPATADASALSDALLDYAEQAWHADQGRHRQIQISCWSCGLSGRLLKRLGLSAWKEAGL